MQGSTYEVVIYETTDSSNADHARREVQSKISALPGFRSYLPLVHRDDPTRRADIVEWDTFEAAHAAAASLPSNPDFAPFLATIASVASMGHYVRQDPTSASEPSIGVEIGFFRLRDGVTEAEARAAHARAVNGFLSHQPGWIAERLVKFDGGLYVDLLFAVSEERARAICDLWHGHDDCRRFASMVEDVDMKFGTSVGG